MKTNKQTDRQIDRQAKFDYRLDATDRSKISSDQMRLFFAVSPYSFIANTPFKTKPEENSIYQALVERIKMKINLRTDYL